MKILLIGGTGTISTAISKLLVEMGHELYLLNRGSRASEMPHGATSLVADINNEPQVAELIKNMELDAVADFIAFTPKDLQRDYRLFKGKTKQFIFISSASAYQKPPVSYKIAEDTPLENPYWQYSRSKIECEQYLMQLYHSEQFPVTIVRPSHTYSERKIPVGVYGKNGSWQVIKRMIEGKPVIIHGDGTSLWTMTHSSDFAKGFVGLIGNRQAIGEAVNITSDEALTWNQIYGYIAKALGVALNPVHVATEFLVACSGYDFTGNLLGDKAHSAVFDNAKLKQLVPNFVATKRFELGIKESVDYVLAHSKECQTPDEEFDRWCDTVVSVTQRAAAEIKSKFVMNHVL